MPYSLINHWVRLFHLCVSAARYLYASACTGSSLDALRGLAALASATLHASDDVAVLTEAYRFCVRVRNRLFLREGRTRDSLPSGPDEVTRLARALGYTIHPRTSLREDYRRITRRARRVMERLFYGIDKPGSHGRA